MSKPTPMSWMGKTLEQEHILRYIDRENPFGEILRISAVNSRMLFVTDCHGTDHLMVCKRDGTVKELRKEGSA